MLKRNGTATLCSVFSLSIGILVSFGSASGQTAGGVVTSSQADSVLVASGLDLYRQHYCGLCHALDRAATAGIFGPTHNALAQVAGERLNDPDYTGKAQTASEYVRESIVAPDVFIVPGFEATVHRMPAYTHLKPEEIDAIVHFLLEAEECAIDECTDSRVVNQGVQETSNDSSR